MIVTVLKKRDERKSGIQMIEGRFEMKKSEAVPRKLHRAALAIPKTKFF
jgi:hypothetical protein